MPPSRQYTNIIVRLPNWLGDVAMATPFLRALREGFPDAKITLLMLPRVRKVLEGTPLADELIMFTHKGLLKDIKMGRELRKHAFDLAIVLPNSFTCAFVMRIAKIPRRVGYALDKRAWLLTDRVKAEKEAGKKRKPVSMVEYYLAFSRHLGCEDRGTQLELPVPEEAEKNAADFLDKNGLKREELVIGFNVGAAFGSSKLWPPEHFARAADMIIEDLDAKAVIFCGPGEERIAEKIESMMKNPVVSTSKNILSIEELKACVGMIDLLVTTDSGPRHFAVAAGTPVVTILGPTDARLTESNTDRTIVLQAEVACGPCHKKICPIEDHPCMTRTTPEQAFDAVVELGKKFFPDKLPRAAVEGGAS